MVELGGTFDSDGYDDMSNFEPIPKGEYLVQVVESDFKTTKDQQGRFIELKFEVLNGEYKGRFIWTRLNVQNKNQMAVDIANKEFATICRAMGKGKITDTQQLHGIPVLMTVKVVPAKGNFDATNSPTGYKPVTENPANVNETSQDKKEEAKPDVPWPT